MARAPHLTAIFSCNDDAAGGAIRALGDMGLTVPDDVSVMGFDDTDVALRTNPPLTTIFVDKFLMGVLSVRQLYDRAIDLERVPIHTTIHTRLIERASVQPRTPAETERIDVLDGNPVEQDGMYAGERRDAVDKLPGQHLTQKKID
jgi:DNA-binding LacI/PurR family transcriptional regulator